MKCKFYLCYCQSRKLFDKFKLHLQRQNTTWFRRTCFRNCLSLKKQFFNVVVLTCFIKQTNKQTKIIYILAMRFIFNCIVGANFHVVLTFYFMTFLVTTFEVPIFTSRLQFKIFHVTTFYAMNFQIKTFHTTIFSIIISIPWYFISWLFLSRLLKFLLLTS